MRLTLLSNSKLVNLIRTLALQDIRGKTLECNHYLNFSSHSSSNIFNLEKRQFSLKLASCLFKRFSRCQIDDVS